jgi:hypothetical protein
LKLTFILMLIASCTTPLLDPKKLYKKNMLLEVNGVQAVGVLVAEMGSVYTIRADFKKKISRIKVDTCHRNYDKNDIGKEWEYFYKKIGGIENSGMCKMKITALNDTGVNSWGLIEFKNESDHNLEAVLKCNGTASEVSGVSICQAKAGLRQSITFKTPTYADTQEECSKLFTYDEKTYYFDMDHGSCVFLFKAGSKYHRLRTFGYDEVLW